MSSPGFQPDGIDGRKMSQEACDRLHALKNRPQPLEVDGEPLTFPPYQYRPYPSAIYGVWSDDRKRQALLDVARLESLNLREPLQREQAEFLIPKWDSRLVENDQERQVWLDKGWTDNPNEIDQAHDHYIANTIAVAAAERAYTDRLMSDKAKAEFRAADRANEDVHLLDLPVPKLNKPRGRPKKAQTTAA
jgi:hypothetical protein